MRAQIIKNLQEKLENTEQTDICSFCLLLNMEKFIQFGKHDEVNKIYFYNLLT